MTTNKVERTMSRDEFRYALASIEREAKDRFATAKTTQDLDKVASEYLGKNGVFKRLHSALWRN